MSFRRYLEALVLAVLLCSCTGAAVVKLPGDAGYRRLGPFTQHCSVPLKNIGPDLRLTARIVTRGKRFEVWFDGGSWNLPGQYRFYRGKDLLFSRAITLGTATRERPVWCTKIDISGRVREGYHCEEDDDVPVLTFGTVKLRQADVISLQQAYPANSANRVLDIRTKRGSFRFKVPSRITAFFDNPGEACAAGVKNG